MKVPAAIRDAMTPIVFLPRRPDGWTVERGFYSAVATDSGYIDGAVDGDFIFPFLRCEVIPANAPARALMRTVKG